MDFDEFESLPTIAVVGGAVLMLIIAPKIMLFLAGLASVTWGLDKVNQGKKG